MSTFNYDIEQGSESWLELRKGKITASMIPIILGQSPWATPLTLWKRMLGFVGEQEDNANMAYGRELEDPIRDDVNKRLGQNFVPCIAFHSEVWRMASLDGYDEVSGQVLEIKCANAKDHEGVKKGKIPKKYFPQVQFQLHCSGSKKALYASYYKGDLEILEVDYNPEYIQSILPAVAEFYRCVIEMEQPKISDDQEIIKSKVEGLKTMREDKKLLCDKIKERETEILAYVGDKEVNSDFLKITYVAESTSVDFKLLWETFKSEIPGLAEKYKECDYLKKRAGFWKITTREDND